MLHRFLHIISQAIKFAIGFIIASVFMASTASIASAAIFIEPYAGYDSGSYDATGTITAPAASTITVKGDMKGSAFGAKAGLGIAGVTLGLDFMHSNLSGKFNNSTTASNFSEDDFGICLGLPIFRSFRINGTYFINSKAKVSGTEYTGNGSKYGLSFSLFWGIYLNLYHISIQHDEAKSNVSTYSQYDGKAESNFIGLSLPLGE